MTVTPQVVVKDCADRVAPRAEPKPPRREGEHRYLPGAVDLLRFRRDPHWGLETSRIVDVARTIDSAIDGLSDSLVECIAVCVGDLGNEIDNRLDDLVRRLERAEAANAALAERNAGLTREIELMQRLDRDRRASAAAKPKAKRKPRGATIEAAPGAKAAS